MEDGAEFEALLLSADGKPKTGHQLFLERMAREGRRADWSREYEERKTEDHNKFGSRLTVEVDVAMGYESRDDEVDKLQTFLCKMHINYTKMMARKLKEIRGDDIDSITFDEAMSLLPDHGDPEEELGWIRSHPAMAYKSRTKSNTEPIIIEARDILYSGAGPAPSKSCVISLQHWCNNHREFFKMVLGQQKNKIAKNSEESDNGDGAGKAGYVFDDLSEINRLISFDSRK